MGHKETKILQGLASGEGAEAKLKKLWDKFDEDKSGELEKDEAEKFFGMMHDFLYKHNKSVFEEYCSQLTKEDCVNLWFAHFDADGNGKISWKEFKETVSMVSNPEALLKKMGDENSAPDSARGSAGESVKIMLAGESNVGKTSLMVRFIDGAFTEEYIPPAQEASKSKVVKIKDNSVKVEVFDTLGQERFRVLTATYFGQCNAVLIVFDLSNPASFERIPTWVKTVLHYTTNCPKVLVGNKCDLKEIKVGKDKIEALCKEYNLQYFEASAKTDVSVTDAFVALASQALLQSRKSKKS